jgi:hypothetical protein
LDPESIAWSGLYYFYWIQQYLLQWRNSGQRLKCLSLAPRFHQLQTMLESPFEHKTEDPRREFSSCESQGIDEDHCLRT